MQIGYEALKLKAEKETLYAMYSNKTLNICFDPKKRFEDVLDLAWHSKSIKPGRIMKVIGEFHSETLNKRDEAARQLKFK